ncbi:glycosyltransferase family 2 protein [Paenibacillus sp. sgz302251]|uniref:glycosyltransferase family 2 protein n=1 Tax=Paenibacillus sp. sgz302251 TaxID=3414493 RepID=UPI003C798CE3
MLTNKLTDPQVSVIIPTLNAGSEFTLLLKRLQQQTIRPYEIIIMDSESTDGTAERARQAGAQLITVKRSEFDHGGTRNRGAEQAKGDILLFMTQDALPYDDKLIEQLTKPLLRDEKVVYAYARQLARPGASFLEQLARESNYPAQSTVKGYEQIEALGIKTFFCSNVCSAIRRETFVEMGRFQEPVIFNEDLFMAAKCILSGLNVAYQAEAVVYHSHEYTIAQQLRRYFDNGISMSCNPWIRPYSAIGGAGSKLVKLQLKGLHEHRKWHLIPGLIAESAAKLIGYKLGYHFNRLPASVTRKLSMHKLVLAHIARTNGFETQQTMKQ